MTKIMMILLTMVVLCFGYVGYIEKNPHPLLKKITGVSPKNNKVNKNKYRKVPGGDKKSVTTIKKNNCDCDNLLSVKKFNISVVGRSVEDAVSVGKYDFANQEINSKNFHPRRNEFDKKEIILLKFSRCRLDSDEAIFFMEHKGLRPATLMELLAFGEKYPDFQKNNIIIALGSTCLNEYGGRMVPVLWGNKDGRSLNLCLYSFKWVDGATFAAVRR